MCVDYLLSLPTCNGRVGATGMCLGGHLAYRCALDSRVKAAVCYFATDIHSKTLAEGKNDDSLARAGDIKGELLMVSPCFRSLSYTFSRQEVNQPLAVGGILFVADASRALPFIMILYYMLIGGGRSSGRMTTMSHLREGI